MSQEEPPVSAYLLARLAEAANGYRTGSKIWFVASYDRDPTDPDPFQVSPPFSSRADAEVEKQSRGALSGVFGPYLTTTDTFGNPTGQKTEVQQIEISIKKKNGQSEKIVVDGEKYDALFWSLSAVEKFVLPYYAGRDFAVASLLKDEFTTSNVYMLGHLPRTVYDTFKDAADELDALRLTDDAKAEFIGLSQSR